MSNKKGISIKDYFNTPSSITQPTAEPSNESAGNTSTSPPNEKTNDKQQPPTTTNNHQKTNLITLIAVMSSQKPSLESKSDHVNTIGSSDLYG